MKWWNPAQNNKTYKDILLSCPASIENKPIPKKIYSYNDNKPVFFGHYWLKGNPIIENPKAICLDYSVAKEGKLVAFQSEYLSNGKLLQKGFVY